MELKSNLQDYTEPEFLSFVEKIWAVDVRKQDHDRLINHFDRIVGHPKGADLLFYPDDQFLDAYAGACSTTLTLSKPHSGRLLPQLQR